MAEPTVEELPSASAQREAILALDKQWEEEQQGQDKEGDVYFVTSAKWWAAWRRYVDFPLSEQEAKEAADDAAVAAAAGGEEEDVEDTQEGEEDENADTEDTGEADGDDGDDGDDGALNESPGVVDNSELVENTEIKLYKLRLDVRESIDYVLLRANVWEQLVGWYGFTHKFRRSVIKQGNDLLVEVHWLRLYVVKCDITTGNKSANPKDRVQLVQSRRQKVTPCLKAIAKRFKSKTENARFWVERAGTEPELVTSDMVYLEDVGLDMDDTLLCELRRGSVWPRERTARAKKRAQELESSLVDVDLHDQYGELDIQRLNGKVGLSNLGNTCFMNSALQCLSNTELLTRYFLLDQYKPHVNKDNVLGSGGQVVTSYAKLIKTMWTTNSSVVTPSAFKRTIGKFAPQFSGFAQQDSQELVAFLLDGLHEDLNLVYDKPNTEKEEAGDKDDVTAAAEAWDQHLLRNRSYVVDLFQGQLKSRIECPKCAKVSVTFDPFMYLSLPLPVQNDRNVEVYVVRAGASNRPSSKPPLKISFAISSTASIGDMRQTISDMVGIPAARLTLGDVYQNKVYNLLPDYRTMRDIKSNDVTFAFETMEKLEPTAAMPYSSKTYLSLGNKKIKSKTMSEEQKEALRTRMRTVVCTLQHAKLVKNPKYSKTLFNKQPEFKEAIFGFPTMVSFDSENTTNADLYRLVRQQIRYYLKPLYEQEHPETTDGGSSSSSSSNGGNAGSEEEAGSSSSAGASQTQEEGGAGATEGDTQETQGEEQEEQQETGDGDGDVLVDQLKGDDSFTLRLIHKRSYTDVEENDQPVAVKDRVVHMQILWTNLDNLAEKNLNMVSLHASVRAMKEKGGKKQAGIGLEDCMRKYLAQETLGENDMWYCSSCREHQRATKKFDLWSMPQVLVIHLKRFRGRYTANKLTTFVDFPIEGLDLSQFVCGPNGEKAVYDLYGVSNHSGGMGFGHYTAYAKNHYNGQWYSFNDTSCRKAGDNIKSNSAYLLFYERRDYDNGVGPISTCNIRSVPMDNSGEDEEASGKGTQGEDEAGASSSSSSSSS